MDEIKNMDLTNIKVLNKTIDLQKYFGKDNVEIYEDTNSLLKTLEGKIKASSFLELIETLSENEGSSKALILNTTKYRKIRPQTINSISNLLEIYEETSSLTDFDYIYTPKFGYVIKLKTNPSRLLELLSLEKDKLTGFVFNYEDYQYLMLLEK